MDYSELYSKFVTEILNSELEKLEKDFYEKVMAELRRERRDVAVEKTLNTLKYLLLLRLMKELRILYSNSFKINLENLPTFERDILSSVISALDALDLKKEAWEAMRRKECKTAASQETGKPKGAGGSESSEEMMLVFFLKPYPRIIDKGISLGPFSRGDVAFIPKRLALNLIASGYAEEIPRH